VAEDGVVADLLELGIRQLQARGGAQVERLAPADLDVDALVAPSTKEANSLMVK
jgi:hypothetical protein